MGINEIIKQKIDDNWGSILCAHGKKQTSDGEIVKVYDGIVDESVYLKQKTKILFLLKDGNNPILHDGNGCTYLDLRNTAYSSMATDTKMSRMYPMWRVMCMWIRIIEEPNCTFNDCLNSKNMFDVDGMRILLSHIATVNVKKTAGAGSCPDNLLNEAFSYFPLIKHEIELINPDYVIVCCGHMDFISEQYGCELKTLSNGKRYFRYGGKNFVEMIHPGAFYMSYKNRFQLFAETYQELVLGNM